jgi:hypothetical protein
MTAPRASFPLSAALFACALLAGGCCGPDADGSNVRRRGDELNPPWTTPERIQIPVPPGTPVSLITRVRNDRIGLVPGEHSYAVFRLPPGPNGEERTHTSPLGAAELEELSRVAAGAGARVTFTFCDPKLREFLGDAKAADVRVQALRNDGYLSYNPPLVDAPIGSDVLGHSNAEGLSLPFVGPLAIERPSIATKYCLPEAPNVSPPQVVDLSGPAKIADCGPSTISRAEPDRVNPPGVLPNRLVRRSSPVPEVSLSVSVQTHANYAFSGQSCVHIYGVKMSSGDVVEEVFPLDMGSIDALTKLAHSPTPQAMTLKLAAAAGKDPFAFTADMQQVYLRIGLSLDLARSPANAQAANTVPWSYTPDAQQTGYKKPFFVTPVQSLRGP